MDGTRGAESWGDLLLMIRLSGLVEEVNIWPLIAFLILLSPHVSLTDLRRIPRGLMPCLLLQARNLLRLLSAFSLEVLMV